MWFHHILMLRSVRGYMLISNRQREEWFRRLAYLEMKKETSYNYLKIVNNRLFTKRIIFLGLKFQCYSFYFIWFIFFKLAWERLSLIFLLLSACRIKNGTLIKFFDLFRRFFIRLKLCGDLHEAICFHPKQNLARNINL